MTISKLQDGHILPGTPTRAVETTFKTKILSPEAGTTHGKTDAFFQRAIQMRGQPHDHQLDERMFAHIHGDGLIEGSGLECHVFSSSMEYAKGEINRIKDGTYQLDLHDTDRNTIEEMSHEMDGCIAQQERYLSLMDVEPAMQTPSTLQAEGKHLYKSICEMKTGEHKLIPGGWAGSAGQAGHAMLYEVVKLGPNRYSFSVINSGDGLGYHPHRINSEGADEALCRVTYTQLDTQDLNEDFFTQLVQTRVAPIWDSSYPNGAQHLYETILPTLTRHKGCLQAPRSDDQAWAPPQKSSICTWQCHVMWEKSRLSPKTFSHLQLCTKVRTFAEFSSRNKARLARESRMTQLVTKMAGELGRYLKKEGLGKFEDAIAQVDLSSMGVNNQEGKPIEEVSRKLWDLPSSASPVDNNQAAIARKICVSTYRLENQKSVDDLEPMLYPPTSLSTQLTTQNRTVQAPLDGLILKVNAYSPKISMPQTHNKHKEEENPLPDIGWISKTIYKASKKLRDLITENLFRKNAS